MANKSRFKTFPELQVRIGNRAAKLTPKARGGHIATGISCLLADGSRHSLEVFFTKSGTAEAYFSIRTKKPGGKPAQTQVDDSRRAFTEENYKWHIGRFRQQGGGSPAPSHAEPSISLIDELFPALADIGEVKRQVALYCIDHGDSASAPDVLKTPPAPSTAAPEFDRLRRDRMAAYSLRCRAECGVEIPPVLDPRRLPLRDLFEVFSSGIVRPTGFNTLPAVKKYLFGAHSDKRFRVCDCAYFMENSLLTAHPGAMLACLLLTRATAPDTLKEFSRIFGRIVEGLRALRIDSTGACDKLAKDFDANLKRVTADADAMLLLNGADGDKRLFTLTLKVVRDKGFLRGSGISLNGLAAGMGKSLAPYPDTFAVEGARLSDRVEKQLAPIIEQLAPLRRLLESDTFKIQARIAENVQEKLDPLRRLLESDTFKIQARIAEKAFKAAHPEKPSDEGGEDEK